MGGFGGVLDFVRDPGLFSDESFSKNFSADHGQLNLHQPEGSRTFTRILFLGYRKFVRSCTDNY